MKIILPFSFFLFGLNILAHGQIYYNKNIDFENTNSWNGYSSLLIDQDTIYSVGSNNIPNALAFYINKLDESANLVLSSSYSSDSTYLFGAQGANSLLKIESNYYSVAGQTDANNFNEGWFVKFNSNLDTIFTKKRNIPNSIGTSLRFSIKVNHNIVTLGDVGYYNSNVNFNFGQVYLVKFDTLANVIWEHEYGNPGTVSEFVKGIYPAVDGGYFIYGYVTGYQQWSQCYLLKVDSMGNQLWQRSWGDIYHDELRGFYEMPNGNLLVSGYISSDFFGGEVTNAYLAMLTPDGSQRIWEKRLFGIIDYDDLSTIFKNNDGTFHIWGHETTPYITRPFLMHFSASFDSLDTKYYSYWNGPGAQNYIRDIVKMPDQGYVACGFGWENGHDQDGWLLRIDSDGCANVNCTPLAIQENTNDIINDVTIFPNPATDKIYIKTKPNEVIKSIRLFDISGTAIKAQITGNEIDISMLANGLYIIEITNVQGLIQRFKALKE
jgi:hypothetical protein